MKFNIYRTHLSGYWPKNFLEIERNSLSRLSQVSYQGLEPDGSKWLDDSIILSNTHFYPENIPVENWKKVRLFLHANSGYDTILSKNFLKAYQGPLLIAPKLRAQAVAEYNLQSWLLGLGTIPFSHQWDKSRNFERRLAKNEKVLLLGLGHVGKLTYKLMQNFGADIDVYDPFVENNFSGKISLIEWNQYSTIIFCCSLTSSSKTLLDWKNLNPEIILINSARGELVDFMQAQSFALKNPEAKIFLDVFHPEPFEHELIAKNIFCSSHIAGVHHNLLAETLLWHEKVISDFCQNCEEKFLSLYQDENLRLKRFDL